MLPTSHLAPIATANAAAAGSVLADSFAEFIAAAGRLESSYKDLQGEVGRLRREAEQRNAALLRSIAETHHARAILQQTIDSMPCAVLVLNSEDQIVSLMNPVAKNLFATQSSLPLPWAQIPKQVLSVLDAKDDSEFEMLFERGNESLWLAVRKASVGIEMSEGFCDSSTVVIARDITLQKKMEAEREQARNTVAVATMSTALAHEIRNPLACMELFTGLLLEAPLPSESRPWAEHLQSGVRSLAATVNNVLQFYGTGTLMLAHVELCCTLRSSVEFLHPLVQQKNISLTFEQWDEKLNLLGNSTAIHQIVMNVCGNSLKHTREGGCISVSVRRHGETAIVELSDNGSGIAPSDLPKVFEAGYSGAGHSVGLGLSVCKRIMDQHNGQIHIASTCGAGTTVTLEFPCL